MSSISEDLNNAFLMSIKLEDWNCPLPIGLKQNVDHLSTVTRPMLAQGATSTFTAVVGGIYQTICWLQSMAAEQLKELKRDIAELAANVEAAKKDWRSATDSQQRATLEKAYESAKAREDRILKLLLEGRQALQAKVSRAGEPSLLLPCQQQWYL